MKIVRPSAVQAICLLLASAVLCTTGCRESATRTTWSTEITSPDSKWTVSARSEAADTGASADRGMTTVYLKSGNQSPVEILRFSHSSPTIGLAMRWISPTHLDVAYSSPGKLEFQGGNSGEVDVTVHGAAAPSVSTQ